MDKQERPILTPEQEKESRTLYRMSNSGLSPRHLEYTYEPGKHPQFDETYSHVKSVLDKNSLVIIVGKRGSGKTQMATAYTRDVCGRQWRDGDFYMKPIVRYTTAMDALADIRKHQNDAFDVAMKRYTECPLLIIDEIQVRSETEWERDILTAIIDKRYGWIKPTLMIGNLNATELKACLGASIMDRAREGGAIVSCDWDSFRGAQ